MKPTLRQLEYIVAIAETGTFSLAARRMNVSQPSLSAQVADCEETLGKTIFERRRGGVQPTEFGLEILRRARVVLREMEDLIATGRDTGIFGGRLRLGVLPSIGPYLLPNVVRVLHHNHPQLRLVLRDDSTSGLAHGLANGELDLIISTPEDYPGTYQMPLFKERLWAGFASDDPLANSDTPIKAQQLRNRTLLTLGQKFRITGIIQDIARQSGSRVSEDYSGSSLDAIRLMAATGAGVAIFPEIYAKTEARRGQDVVLRQIAMGSAARQLALIQRHEKAPREGSDILHEVLKAEAGRILAENASSNGPLT